MKKQIIGFLALLVVSVSAAGCGNTSQPAATEPAAAEPAVTETEQAAETEKSDEAVTDTKEETADKGEESLEVSNKLFTITLPDAAVGKFVTDITDNRTAVYDKEAKEAGYGGYAFDVAAYKGPSEYAGGMDKKVGEFTSEDGTLYDIVMQFPSDVQYDYTKYENGMPESYALLYDGAEDIVKTLKGADGKGEFIWGAGAKGDGLYDDVIEKHIKAIKEGWDANRLEEENMSPEYYALSKSGEDVLGKTGYAYFDVNHDGVEELFIGHITDGEGKGMAYDIYTIVDRKPAHVLSGTTRDGYYALKSGLLVNEYYSGADEHGWKMYDIEPNTTNLLDQVYLKIDGYENKEKPWFVSYDNGETWENETEQEFEDYKKNFSDYNRFDFTPFSSVGETTGSESGNTDTHDLGMIEGHKQTTDTEGCDTFTQMIDRTFSDGQGYANEPVGDDEGVFIVAESTFSGEKNDAATDAEIFAYKGDNGIAYLGFLRCGGTATPLAIKDGNIYTAGHHYVGKHTVKDGSLVTLEEAWETFDTDGNGTCHYRSGGGKDQSVVDGAEAEKELDRLNDEYQKAEPIAFATVKK